MSKTAIALVSNSLPAQHEKTKRTRKPSGLRAAFAAHEIEGAVEQENFEYGRLVSELNDRYARERDGLRQAHLDRLADITGA